MSTYKITDWVKEELLSPDTRANPRLMSTIMSLGMTAENVAERYGITREKQDQFALQSQLKAAKAQELGLFKGSIQSIQIRQFQSRPRSQMKRAMKRKQQLPQTVESERKPLLRVSLNSKLCSKTEDQLPQETVRRFLMVLPPSYQLEDHTPKGMVCPSWLNLYTTQSRDVSLMRWALVLSSRFLIFWPKQVFHHPSRQKDIRYRHLGA